MLNGKRLKKIHKLDSAKIALDWLERGISPVPLAPRTKRPSGGTGWNKLRATRATIDRYFHEGYNVGGLWGEPSEWIVDIDLDVDEAVRFANYFLPKTFTYGRVSRPRTHYLYRSRGATSAKWIIGKGKDAKILVELRSTGSQSVLPPSVHPDRERYEIDEDLPFTPISRVVLTKLLDKIAAGTLLIQSFPEEGGRHDFIHALAGALMWAGWLPQDAKAFLMAFLESTAEADEEHDDRETTVKNTIEHFKKGDRVAGWTTLKTWLPAEHLQAIRKWLEPPREFKAPPKLAHDEVEIKIPPMDKALTEVPGLVGEIAAWGSRRAFRNQPAFSVALGLMTTALTAANKYVVDGWSTPLQPYIMLIAPTSGGKESVLDSMYEYAHKIRMHENCVQGFQSQHALMDRLTQQPALACWLWDEAARRLRSSRNPNSMDYAILTWVLSLYGKAQRAVAGMPGRKQEIPPLDKPCLTVLAAAQPAQLIEAVTVSDLAAGFVNRFLLFDSGDVSPDANLRRSDIFPSALKKAAKRMKRFEPRELPVKIRFDSTATWAMFRDFDEEARTHAAEDGGNEIWGRANQNALIAAGIVAVGVHEVRPMITEEIARWSIALVKWSIACWTARIGEASARSFREKESKAVERYIVHAKLYAKKMPKELQTAGRQGAMPVSYLKRLCRHLSSRDLADIVDQLTASGLIEIGDVAEQECYWPVR